MSPSEVVVDHGYLSKEDGGITITLTRVKTGTSHLN